MARPKTIDEQYMLGEDEPIKELKVRGVLLIMLIYSVDQKLQLFN